MSNNSMTINPSLVSPPRGALAKTSALVRERFAEARSQRGGLDPAAAVFLAGGVVGLTAAALRRFLGNPNQALPGWYMPALVGGLLSTVTGSGIAGYQESQQPAVEGVTAPALGDAPDERYIIVGEGDQRAVFELPESADVAGVVVADGAGCVDVFTDGSEGTRDLVGSYRGDRHTVEAQLPPGESCPQRDDVAVISVDDAPGLGR